MIDIYNESVSLWKQDFINRGEEKIVDEIMNRLNAILSGDRHRTDTKDYFVYEIMNCVDISNIENVILYVHKKLN